MVEEEEEGAVRLRAVHSGARFAYHHGRTNHSEAPYSIFRGLMGSSDYLTQDEGRGG